VAFGTWVGSYVVGDFVPSPFQAYTWPKIEELVERWAGHVKADLETPDLWAQLQGQRELLSRTPDEAENTPFTPDEQAEILKGLAELEEWVYTHPLSPDQAVVVDKGFKQVVAAIKRGLGRSDVRLMFYGVVLTLIVSGIVTPDAMHGFLWTALHALEHFFGGPSPPQLPPPI
jgi:hypothetical protein